jgi:hypothetical protein
LIAGRRVLQAAATSSARRVRQGSSRAGPVHDPSIRHAPALPVPADLGLRAVVRDLALVRDSERRGPGFLGHAQVVVLLRLEKLLDRSAPRTIEGAAVASSIRRRRKDQ